MADQAAGTGIGPSLRSPPTCHDPPARVTPGHRTGDRRSRIARDSATVTAPLTVLS
ncbi:hypothetical protein GCM10027610_025480 [Dactylosporangium cerinum]